MRKTSISALFLLFLSLNCANCQNIFWRTNLRITDASRYYWCDNAVTSTHESTHAINSMLRQRHGGICLYVFHGTYAWFKPLRVPTLRQVAAQCRHQGDIYNLYLVRQRQWWNNEPGYLLDELVCYTNGAETACSYYPNQQHWSSLLYAMEMAYYSWVMIEMVSDTYPDKPLLRQFWNWQVDRIGALYQMRIHHHSKQDWWFKLLLSCRARSNQ